MSKQIMIIEDDLTIASTLQNVLDYTGYTHIHASNGLEGLSKLEAASNLPDLLIVDIMMPVMDGIEFRKRQLENDKLKNIPVIFLTASQIDRSDVIQLKPYEFLLKPIDLDDFLTILENFFFTK